jgi:hypothetical protein
MNAQLVIAIVFAALLITFLVVAYFIPPKSTGQDSILRILATLCAGFSGALLPGGISVQATLHWSSATTLAVSAFGAMGLATLIWLTWRTVLPQPTPDIVATFPDDTTFGQAAEIVARLAKEPVVLAGFSPSQEAQRLRSSSLRAPTYTKAFERLGRNTGLKEFPSYAVTHADGKYTLNAQK